VYAALTSTRVEESSAVRASAGCILQPSCFMLCSVTLSACDMSCQLDKGKGRPTKGQRWPIRFLFASPHARTMGARVWRS